VTSRQGEGHDCGLLRTIGLTKDFGGLRALNKLDLLVAHREIVGLIGPNGSGKSTFVNVISGFYEPTSGQVVFASQPVGGLPPWKIARRGITRTFQHTRLFHKHTVLENMLFAAHTLERSNLGHALFRRGLIRKEKHASHNRARQILEFVGLSTFMFDAAASLPPGHQRALAIGMCLVSEPKLLMLDEPAAGLSAKESERLVSLIATLKDRGVSVLLVDHDMRVIMSACDRIVVLDHGIKIAEGRPEEIRTNEKVVEAYLGRDTLRAAENA